MLIIITISLPLGLIIRASIPLAFTSKLKGLQMNCLLSIGDSVKMDFAKSSNKSYWPWLITGGLGFRIR